MRWRSGLVWLILVLLTLANGFWFLWSPPQTGEATLRIVCGGLFYFLVPGMVLGEVFRFRAREVPDLLAKAFALTLLLAMLFLGVVLVLQTRIAAWVGLIQAATWLGLAIICLRLRRETPRFLYPLASFRLSRSLRGALQLFCLLIPILMATAAYRLGENLDAIRGEKYVHLMFLRNYHDLPLVLNDLGVVRGMPPPNLVQLWEFLLAGWSRGINVEPLAVFFRARFLIPILGLSSLYLLVSAIFLSRRRSLAVFGVALLLCLAELIFRGGGLAWVQHDDPTRGVGTFFGTSHHADPAMEILVPLGAALSLLFIQRPSFRHLILYASALFASFLWHPREFLQVASYLGILVLATLGFRLRLPQLVRLYRRIALASLVVIGCGGICSLLSSRVATERSHCYDELAIKKYALRLAVKPTHLFGFRNFFHFPGFFVLNDADKMKELLDPEQVRTGIAGDWQGSVWLILSGIAASSLLFLGSGRAHALAGFSLVLWFVGLCWNCGMLGLLFFTYSEFYHVGLRMVYVFAYPLLGCWLIELVPWLARLLAVRGKQVSPRLDQQVRQPAALSLVLLLGLGACLLLPRLEAKHWFLFAVSTVCYAALLAFWLRRPGVSLSPSTTSRSSLSGAVLFLLPFLLVNAARLPARGYLSSRQQPAWDTNNNPFGFSQPFLAWLKGIEPCRNFLVHPESRLHVAVYSPQYMVVVPGFVLIRDQEARREYESGRHPVFSNRKLEEPTPLSSRYAHGNRSLSEAHRWITEEEVDYLLLNGSDYQGALRNLVESYPNTYRVVFDNPPAHELVLAVSH